MGSTAKFTWQGQDVTKLVHAVGAKALFEGAEFILDEANKTIPHQEGMMQDSGDTDVDEAALEASVRYDTPYTVKQHQDTRLRHPNGRRARWLALTLEEKGKKVQAHIASRLKEALAKNGKP